jgi:acetate kinase
MTGDILTCNAGSSSVKAGVFDLASLGCCYRFEADHIHDTPHCVIEDSNGGVVAERHLSEAGYAHAICFFLQWLTEYTDISVVACGHRIVHGGSGHAVSAKLDKELRAELEALVPLAPLHQPHNMALIDVVAEQLPRVTHIACFDTAFHRTQPELHQRYALPASLDADAPIVRYGFHGLSYEYIAHILPQHAGDAARGKVIAIHLGNGASACAMHHQKSVATTMGFTALDGLMMGTRCGDLDPGVILYLLQQRGMGVRDIEALLYTQSGLLGVSGISHDMRALCASSDPRARDAIELFCLSAARQMGGLVPLLGGVDALVFTGAMGKHNAEIRQRICAYFSYLGLKIEPSLNAANADCVSSENSTIPVYALATDEEWMIARHTQTLYQQEVA